ncbi:hypothetical protein PanWU01x14_122110 [Parasponia andersonii]|uniref:Uncharacterized protein n=1 Tax=Parasponia andersonii TaxID=3476 RepID=A0A2P5CUW1_PARAD|nr:hypothetical protein PanWU01x14_122110 [Parasponia andersonii]
MRMVIITSQRIGYTMDQKPRGQSYEDNEMVELLAFQDDQVSAYDKRSHLLSLQGLHVCLTLQTLRRQSCRA